MSEDLRPEDGSFWQHSNGNTYVVMFIANKPDNDRDPETVVYRSLGNDNVWARPLSDWHRSMRYVRDPR